MKDEEERNPRGKGGKRGRGKPVGNRGGGKSGMGLATDCL